MSRKVAVVFGEPYCDVCLGRVFLLSGQPELHLMKFTCADCGKSLWFILKGVSQFMEEGDEWVELREEER